MPSRIRESSQIQYGTLSTAEARPVSALYWEKHVRTQFGDRLRVPELVASFAGLLQCLGRSLAHGEQLNGLLYFLDPLCWQGVHLDKTKRGEKRPFM